MSEPTLISPLLDGFTMGQPISEHDGVSCCPAIKEDTDNKYIIKIITIPATQTQFDALLLAVSLEEIFWSKVRMKIFRIRMFPEKERKYSILMR